MFLMIRIMEKGLVLACIAIMAAGCTKSLTEGKASLPEIVSVDVSVPVSCMTKVTDISGESDIRSLQVLVFRPDGQLEAYAEGETQTVSFDCTSGEKKIVAAVNAQSLTDVKTFDAMEAKVSDLKDNSHGAFVMSGILDTEISSSVSSVTVPVTRHVARVSIEKVTNRIDLEQYRDIPLEISGIYLVNAAGDRTFGGAGYTPSVWYNKGACSGGGDLPSLLYSGDLAGTSVASGASYTTAHYFYCYPNPVSEDNTDTPEWTPGFTRIVVEVNVDGHTYYYPLSIENIESNHTYTVTELIITRLGSDDPDIPVSVESASFTVEVKDWEEGFSGSVTI